jgi:hypothetical protein
MTIALRIGRSSLAWDLSCISDGVKIPPVAELSNYLTTNIRDLRRFEGLSVRHPTDVS